MLTTLMLFIGSMLAWWGALWWGMPVNWQRISPSAILLLHTLPPLLFASSIRIFGWLKARKARQQAAEQAAREAQAQQAQQQAAREQHEAAIRLRQQTVECRGVWVSTLSPTPPQWIDELPPGCSWQTLEPEALEPGELRTSLTPVLSELLQQVYNDTPEAMHLPLYLVPMAELAGAEQLQWIKPLQQQAAAEIDPEQRLSCRFMPEHGPLGDRVLQLLRQDPELPGLLTLSLDAPWASEEEENDDAFAPAPVRSPAPGLALVAMLFLRPGLPMPESMPAQQAGEDPYQPYWDKNTPVRNAHWGGVPAEAQLALLTQPALASLSQSAEALECRGGALSLSKAIRPLLDQCMLNAGLSTQPFGEEIQAQAEAKPLSWLIHNSGPVESGGTRLAAVGNVLGTAQVDLNPIDQASNIVREWGDVGQAASALLAASAVCHSARLEAPVVMTQFAADSVNLAIITPPAEQESV